jgi:hypothetical protein
VKIVGENWGWKESTEGRKNSVEKRKIKVKLIDTKSKRNKECM